MSSSGRDPDESFLPEQTSDERDYGWGNQPDEADPDDLDRFLSERPPHHGD